MENQTDLKKDKPMQSNIYPTDNHKGPTKLQTELY